MLIDRVYLRNYRVFEEELDLAIPPGLVGVFGPNGAGKSTLLESILWALWGQARTKKEEVPSAGARGECVAEVTFEHEGHIYLVRRTIAGANATVRAEAHCDGLAMAEGVRDTGRYVHSVLGMDDRAFRASVFAEQKQLAAFSDQGPAERRKLVLSLLGVTPLDSARDRARADARHTAEQHDRLRGMLPDLDEAKVRAADAQARAGAAETGADEEERAAAAAGTLAQQAKERVAQLDLLHQEHERLVLEGRAARDSLEVASQQAEKLKGELAQLATVESQLAELQPSAARLPTVQAVVLALKGVLEAAQELDALPVEAEPPAPDSQALVAAEEAARRASAVLGSAQGQRESALAQVERAKAALARSGELSDQEACPLCGQPLGDAFAQVQSHRAAEVSEAEACLEAAESAFAKATADHKAALVSLGKLSTEVEKARQAHLAWQHANARRTDGARRLETAMAALAEVAPLQAHALRVGQTGGARRGASRSVDEGAAGTPPAPQDLGTAADQGHGASVAVEAVIAILEEADAEAQVCRRAAEEASHLRGRLERRPQAQEDLAQAEQQAAEAGSAVEVLLAKVKALAFDPTSLVKAKEELADADEAAQLATGAATRARREAIRARTEAEGEAKRLVEAQAQHAQLAELATQSVHLGRVAELLNAFRNDVVATVGPRLAVQAAELFAELTDNEYDRLEVDPETYGLQISDAGLSYGLERFSGSEVDLANLALRVAISEHVRLLSGGTVGLLVLDEVFGPLDEERKARMLQALERLRGRFRQILVVTHSTDIKEQLPNAIEIVKKPGRRAMARVVQV